MHPQFGTCSLGHCKGMAAIFPWRPLYQKKRGNGPNLPIARETRITKELLSGPTQSRLVALLLLSQLPIPSPLIARHSHRAKKMRLCLMPSNLIALLPSDHPLCRPPLISPLPLSWPPLIPHVPHPPKEMRLVDLTPSRLVALLPSIHRSLPPLLQRLSHRAKEMRLDLTPSQLIALLPS